MIAICGCCGKPKRPNHIPQGLGSALKPAMELICLAQKPLERGLTLAANVLRHGTGAINVDACRVGFASDADKAAAKPASLPGPHNGFDGKAFANGDRSKNRPDDMQSPAGRYPANLLHDGSPEVEQAFAAFGEKGGGFGVRGAGGQNGIYSPIGGTMQEVGFGDTGSASRFFQSCPWSEAEWIAFTSASDAGGSTSRFHYSSKADASDRAGSKHPTVKPASLMRWLVRLITPPNGTVLDPFAGTGSTGLAADQCGMRSVLIERDPTYAGDALRKIREDAPLFAEASPVPDLDAAEAAVSRWEICRDDVHRDATALRHEDALVCALERLDGALDPYHLPSDGGE